MTATDFTFVPSRVQLYHLRTEAAEAGDFEQVALCDRAALGDREALEECARVILDAAAQDDDSDDY